MDPKATIVKEIGNAIESTAPKLLAEGLEKAAKSQDNEIAKTGLLLVSGLIEAHGPSVIKDATRDVVNMIDGQDSGAAFRFLDQPEKIEALVSALQSSEAKRKDEAKAWMVAAEQAMSEFFSLVIKRSL